jgi:MFS family permease
MTPNPQLGFGVLAFAGWARGSGWGAWGPAGGLVVVHGGNSNPLRRGYPHASLVGVAGWALAIFAVAALPGYLLAAATIDTIGRRALQATGFTVMAAAFVGLWLLPGATYFFAEFGPNTATFVYPAGIFPVRVRTTSHGIAAAAGKIGAFIGTYALTALLPAIGQGQRPGHPGDGRACPRPTGDVGQVVVSI